MRAEPPDDDVVSLNAPQVICWERILVFHTHILREPFLGAAYSLPELIMENQVKCKLASCCD